MIKLNSKQLRKIKPEGKEMKQIKRNPIYFVLDNVIDTYNIGSLFRLADAVAAEKLYICGGDSEYPPNSRIHKAAVGTEEWVFWEYKSSTIETIKNLKDKGVYIVAVEQDKEAISYQSLAISHWPTAIVVGNETTGVSKEVLDMADIIVELPMFGVNKSLNVWGSAAIIAYTAIEGLLKRGFNR